MHFALSNTLISTPLCEAQTEVNLFLFWSYILNRNCCMPDVAILYRINRVETGTFCPETVKSKIKSVPFSGTVAADCR